MDCLAYAAIFHPIARRIDRGGLCVCVPCVLELSYTYRPHARKGAGILDFVG